MSLSPSVCLFRPLRWENENENWVRKKETKRSKAISNRNLFRDNSIDTYSFSIALTNHYFSLKSFFDQRPSRQRKRSLFKQNVSEHSSIWTINEYLMNVFINKLEKITFEIQSIFDVNRRFITKEKTRRWTQTHFSLNVVFELKMIQIFFWLNHSIFFFMKWTLIFDRCKMSYIQFSWEKWSDLFSS